MNGWKTTKHGRSGLRLEMGGHYHMLGSIFINHKMKNDWQKKSKEEKNLTIGN